MEKLSRASTLCLFGQDAEISLAQIILGSDYSRSVKNYGDYFCQFREMSFERNLVRKRPLRRLV